MNFPRRDWRDEYEYERFRFMSVPSGGYESPFSYEETKKMDGEVQAVKVIADGSFSSLQIVGNCLYGKNQHAIKMWNLKVGECIKTIEDSTITCFIATRANLFAASNTGSIKKWNFSDESFLESQIHTSEVTCLQRFDGSLFSGSKEGSIVQCDTDLKVIRQFSHHTAAITCLSVSNKGLFSASLDHTAIKWSLEGADKVIFKGHESKISSIAVTSFHLFTAGETDKKLNMWDIENGELKHTFLLRGFFPTVQIDNEYVIASVGDSTEQIVLQRWNYNSKELMNAIAPYNWFSAGNASGRYVNSFVMAGKMLYMAHNSRPHLTIFYLTTHQNLYTLLDDRIIPFDSTIQNHLHYYLGDEKAYPTEIVDGGSYICLREGKKIVVLDFNYQMDESFNCLSDLRFLFCNGIKKICSNNQEEDMNEYS